MNRKAAITTALDMLGVALIVAFAYFVWAPLALLVGGAAALVASWRANG